MTEPTTRPPFTPLRSQPPQLPNQFSQPQVFTQNQQRFPPDGAVSSSFGISSGTGSQSTSDFTQSFVPQQEEFRTSGASPSSIDNTFSNFPGRVPLRQFPDQSTSTTEDSLNGARVRIRPVGTIGNTDPIRAAIQPTQTDVPDVATSPRARQPVLDNEDDESRLGPTGVRVVRIRPTSRPFRTENFTPIEFNPQEEATPPPVISRVRGRPIVPDDFPGNPLAIRGSVPSDEGDVEDLPTGPGQESDDFGRGRFPSSSTTGTRTRGRVRIVPTGNRARRPIDENNDPSEEPRASINQLRPINRIPFSSTGSEEVDDEDEGLTASGFPRRRLRPTNRLVPTRPPTRTLRPFVEIETPSTTQAPSLSTSEELVPTAPSVSRDKSRVQDLLRQALLSNEPTTPDSTSGDDHFDPNHLLAHVQAVKAVEESNEEGKRTKPSQERTTQKVLDDSEESNIIPLSAIPTSSVLENPQSDDITVINLQKEKTKQNFKGFVDSDLIDKGSTLAFIPTRPPPVQTSTSTTSVSTTDNQPATSQEFIPTSRVTSRPVSTFESTTTPFVRIPFGPFSLSDNQEKQKEEEEKEEQPKVSVSVSTSFSKSSSSEETSTTSSTSTKDINDELDRLQSSLDPWARIQQQLKEKEEEQVTEEPPTTTKLSLFRIRTLPPLPKRTTTTFKPRSLADLFKHREGIKLAGQGGEQIPEEEETTESIVKQTSEDPQEEDRASGGGLSNLFNRNRVNSFVSKSQQTTTTTTTTTERPTLGGFRPRPSKGPTVKDLLASIPKDDLSSLLPKDFDDKRKPLSSFRRPSSPTSIVQDDVSKFLPPGFKFEETTSTTTTTDQSLIEDILSSIEQDDLAKLLPKDFKFDSSPSSKFDRPKPPRLFKPTSSETTSTSTTEESTTESKTKSILNSVKFDDVSAFLPPGFNPNNVEQTTTTTTKKPEDFKLDISSLFSDIETEDVSKFLPPGFDSTEAPVETEKTTEKIVLKFPTRPGGSTKDYESSTKATGISGPPPFVPKIKSFEDR